MASLLIRPNFFGPYVTVLTGFHCNLKISLFIINFHFKAILESWRVVKK